MIMAPHCTAWNDLYIRDVQNICNHPLDICTHPPSNYLSPMLININKVKLSIKLTLNTLINVNTNTPHPPGTYRNFRTKKLKESSVFSSWYFRLFTKKILLFLSISFHFTFINWIFSMIFQVSLLTSSRTCWVASITDNNILYSGYEYWHFYK